MPDIWDDPESLLEVTRTLSQDFALLFRNFFKKMLRCLHFQNFESCLKALIFSKFEKQTKLRIFFT